MKSVRKSLHIDAAKFTINAFVISRIDYHNCRHTGEPSYQLERLQEVLNEAAELPHGAPGFSHITSLLSDKLRWLKCQKRVQFKLCVIIDKALHNMAPVYLKELCIASKKWESINCIQLANKIVFVIGHHLNFLKGLSAYSLEPVTRWYTTGAHTGHFQAKSENIYFLIVVF